MVDGRVVRRPRGGNRFLKLNFGLSGRFWLNWRSGGALRWKVETVGWEGREVVCEKPAPPRLQPPLVSVKYRWVGPASKYWTYRSHAGDMGLVSLVAGHQQKVGFAPTAPLVGSWEKLGTNPHISQPSCCGLCQEPFFSGAVVMLNFVDD
jgi:hypothetical protein